MTMTVDEVLAALEKLGSETTKRTLLRHGACEPIFGVKVGDLQKLRKQIKVDHPLALALYETGVSDAMYLAGLIVDDARMTKRDLERWAKGATWSMLSDYTVAQTAAQSPHGWELGLKWIDAKAEKIQCSGWATLSNFVSITPDDQLDIATLKKLLQRVEKSIHQAPDRVRYLMNGFVLCVGGYVVPLTKVALAAAEKIGVVQVDMGDTECKVPFVPDYLAKMKSRGVLGKKRKAAKC
jgi:3-methyladenine DNA glycosylase AlkD